MATLSKTLLALMGVQQGVGADVPPGLLAFARLLGLRPDVSAQTQEQATPAPAPAALVLATLLAGAFAPARSEGVGRFWSGGGVPEGSTLAGAGQFASGSGGAQFQNRFYGQGFSDPMGQIPAALRGRQAGVGLFRSGGAYAAHSETGRRVVAAMADRVLQRRMGGVASLGSAGLSDGLDGLYARIRTFQHSRLVGLSGWRGDGTAELSGYTSSGLKNRAVSRLGRGFAALQPHGGGQVGAFLDQSCFVPPPAEAHFAGQSAPVVQGVAQAMVAARQQVQAQWVGSGQAYLHGMGQALSQARSMAARRPSLPAPAVAVPLLAPSSGAKENRQSYDFQESFLKTHARHANMGLS